MAQVMGHAVGGAGVMASAQALARDRNEFRPSARGPRRLREVAADAPPQHVALAADHPHHVGADVLVVSGLDARGEGGVYIGVGRNLCETVAATGLRLPRLAEQALQHAELDAPGLGAPYVGASCQSQEVWAGKRCEIHFNSCLCSDF